MKEKIVISFSGGETSGCMSAMLKEKYSLTHELTFIFANTGCELEGTLEFVQRCDEEFGLNLVWVEAVTNPIHGKGVRHKVVDFESASRGGVPFEAFIAKDGIPGVAHPKCSDRLKTFPIESYKKDHGLKGCRHAIGIRADEYNRVSEWAKKEYNVFYPLCEDMLSDKTDVNNFWEDMPFRLDLKSYEGNCEVCWKKSDNKLFMIAHENPHRFNFFERMESLYSHIKPNDNGMPRRFFRKYRSVEDIKRQAQVYNIERLKQTSMFDDDNSGCSEACNGYGSKEGGIGI